MTTRIVHILHHSPSLLHREPLAELLARSAWHVEVARFQRRYLNQVDVECWTPERSVRRVTATDHRGVPHLFFPSVALGYQRELSPALVRHLGDRAGEIDWVFLHGSVGILPALLLSRFGRKLRIVVQNHGETSTRTRCARPGANTPIDYWLRVPWERRAFARAHAILCPNLDAMDDYRSNGVPEHKLAIGTMGVDVEIFRPLSAPRSTLRAELGIRPAGRCVGFVGRLSPEKRVGDLIAALDLLPSDVALVVVGDGPLRGALTGRGKPLVAEGRLVFAGTVADREVLNRWYNAFDLLVLPSAHEGFPMVVVEALAAGTRVLASDLGGTRALLADGVCGSLTRARDPHALARSILAALDADTDAERSVERAHSYSWQSVCARHAAILGMSHASPGYFTTTATEAPRSPTSTETLPPA